MMIKKLLLTTVLCSAVLVGNTQAGDYAAEFPAVGEPSPAYRYKMNALLDGINNAQRPDYIAAMHQADDRGEQLNDSLRYDRMDAIAKISHASLTEIMDPALNIKQSGTLTNRITEFTKLRTNPVKGQHYGEYIAALRKLNSGPKSLAEIYQLERLSPNQLNPVTDKVYDVAQRFPQYAGSSLFEIVAGANLDSLDEYLGVFTAKVAPHIPEPTGALANSSGSYGPISALRTITKVPHDKLNAVADKFEEVTHRFPQLASGSLFHVVAAADLNTFEDYLDAFTRITPHVPEPTSEAVSSSGDSGLVTVLQALVGVSHENLNTVVGSTIESLEKKKASDEKYINASSIIYEINASFKKA